MVAASAPASRFPLGLSRCLDFSQWYVTYLRKCIRSNPFPNKLLFAMVFHRINNNPKKHYMLTDMFPSSKTGLDRTSKRQTREVEEFMETDLSLSDAFCNVAWSLF